MVRPVPTSQPVCRTMRRAIAALRLRSPQTRYAQVRTTCKSRQNRPMVHSLSLPVHTSSSFADGRRLGARVKAIKKSSIGTRRLTRDTKVQQRQKEQRVKYCSQKKSFRRAGKRAELVCIPKPRCFAGLKRAVLLSMIPLPCAR